MADRPATQTTTEIVVLRLRQEVSDAAGAATGALDRLERQISREQDSLSRLEGAFTRAKAKLAAMSEGEIDPKGLAAIVKQRDTVDGLTRKLTEAKAALAQNKLETDDLERAQKEADGLARKLEVATEKLSQLEKVGPGRSVNVEAYRRQADEVAKLGATVEAQKDKIGALSEKHSKLKTDDSEISKLTDALKANGVSADVANTSVGKLVATFAKMGPEVGAVVAAVVLLTATFGALVSVMVRGVGDASRLRNEFLRLKGEVASLQIGWFGFFRGATVNATMLQDAIGKVSPSSALPRDQIEKYAVQLAKARVPANELTLALRAMSTAGIINDAMAQRFLGMATTARMLGQSIKTVSDLYIKQFGPIAQQMTLSLDVQMAKLAEEVRYLFSGADIDALLNGVAALLSIFDRNTESAQGMREVITSMVERGINLFLRFEIAILKTYVWLREHQPMWERLEIAVKAVGLAFAVLASVAGVAMIAMSVAVGLAMIPLVTVGVVILKDIQHWDWLREHVMIAGFTMGQVIDTVRGVIGAFLEWIANVDFSEVGADIVKGIVEGIKSTASTMYDALTDAVFGSIEQTRNRSEIHSPSKLTFRMVGVPLAEGITGGIEYAAPDIGSSLGDAVERSVSVPDRPIGSPQIAPLIQTESTAPISQNEPVPTSTTSTQPSEASESPRASFVFNNCSFDDPSSIPRWQAMFKRILESEPG